MKKLGIKTAIAALLSAMILSGCGATDNALATETTTAQTDKTAEATESTQAQPENKINLSELGTRVGEQYYYLGITEDYIENILSLDSSRFVVLHSQAGYDVSDSAFVTVFDLMTGEKNQLIVDEGSYATIATISGHIAVMRANNGTLTVYNDKLEKTDEWTFPMNDETVNAIIHLSEDKAAVRGIDNKISLVEVDESGKLLIDEKTYKPDEGFHLGSVSGLWEDRTLVVTEYNERVEHLYLWNTQSGEKTRINPDCQVYSSYVIGNRVVGVNDSDFEVKIYSNEHPSIVKSFGYPDNFTAISCADSNDHIYFATAAESIQTLKRYSLQTGELKGELISDAQSDCYFYYISEVGDYVVVGGTVDGRSGVFVWEPKAQQTQGELTALIGDEGIALAEELEEEIEKSYGIEIYTGEDAVRCFGGYAVRDEKGSRNIINALREIESVYAELPEGFIDEMMSAYGEEAKLSIYLTGDIIPDESYSESISDAAAFTYLESGTNHIIVVDITQTDIDSTIAHELMHCIEDAVYSLEYSKGKDFETFERWNMLNPPDFTYVGTYTDEDGNTTGYDVTEYTGTYYQSMDAPLDSVYFVDGYATSYAREDMARIFENIFFSEKTPLPDYFDSVNLRLKSAYLCACIREAFDCMEGVEACWEESLDDNYTLEYFKENYDLEAYYENLYAEAMG